MNCPNRSAAPHPRVTIPRERLLRQPPPDPDADLLGQAVGPYTVRARLGNGGFGTVYQADRSDGQFEQKAPAKG
jgi:serine/threonine-protein kinase